jgi:ribose-phosphate pyrophosphokinase
MSEITLYHFDYIYGLTDIEVEFLTFPGGEEHVKLDPHALKDHEHLVIDVRISDASGMLRVLMLNDAIARNSSAFVTLFIPYLPGARQDRGAPLSAKVYADLINSCDFDEVITVDPHSDVMPALINKLTIIPAEDVFVRPTHVNRAHVTLVVPDQGAGKRVEAVAMKFGYDRLAYARKHRDMQTGKLSHFSIEPIYTPHAIVVDDICDGGGTFLGLADEIVKTNLKTMNPIPILDLWVTHGIFSGTAPMNLEGHFRSITCTDSFPTRQGTENYSTHNFSLTRVELKTKLQAVLNETRYT